MKKQIFGFLLVTALNGFAAEEAAETKAEEAPVEEAPVVEAVKPEAPPLQEEKMVSQAVPAEAPKSMIGPSPLVLGVNFGQIRTNNSDEGNLEKVAYSGGASIEYRLVDQWFIQAEINYMTKGWRVRGTLPGDEISLKYFEIPLFFKVKFPWNNVAPALMAGPWIAYLHSASNQLNGVSFDTTSTTKRFEYGIYVGAELGLALSEQVELAIGARYGWGLTDLNEVPLSNAVFNRVIHLNAGLRFRL